MGKHIGFYSGYEVRWVREGCFHIIDPDGKQIRRDFKSLDQAPAFLAQRLGQTDQAKPLPPPQSASGPQKPSKYYAGRLPNDPARWPPCVGCGGPAYIEEEDGWRCGPCWLKEWIKEHGAKPVTPSQRSTDIEGKTGTPE